IVYFPLRPVSNDGPLPVTCRERCCAASLTAAGRRVTMRWSREGGIERGAYAADWRGGCRACGGFGGPGGAGAPAAACRRVTDRHGLWDVRGRKGKQPGARRRACGG